MITQFYKKVLLTFSYPSDSMLAQQGIDETRLVLSKATVPNLTWFAPMDPAPGQLFHYLVRVENPCGSTMGLNSGLVARGGPTCP